VKELKALKEMLGMETELQEERLRSEMET